MHKQKYLFKDYQWALSIVVQACKNKFKINITTVMQLFKLFFRVQLVVNSSTKEAVAVKHLDTRKEVAAADNIRKEVKY